jgi:hypothetical protein
MRKVDYELQRESFEDMLAAGRYNESLEIVFRDKSGKHIHKLGAGRSDEIDVYRDGKETFVLARNFGLGYVGLEIFNGDEKVGDMFIQNDSEIDEIVGSLELAPYTIIRRLAQYIY